MKRMQNIAWIIVGIGIILYIVIKIVLNSFTGHFMGNEPQKAKAVIIDKRNYLPNQPVKAEFTYSYQFEVNGEKYTGNSHDTSLKVGDSVEVEYNNEHPDINHPMHPKE